VKNAMQLKAVIKNLAKEKHISAQLVMQNFMLERLLERISVSKYQQNFILKGGFLIAAMVGLDTRATMDMDATIKTLPVSAIYMARNGSSKEEIKEYIEGEFNYNLDRTLDEIRPEYHMDETCQRTVPEAIIAFLESKDFEDAVRNAVSLGGDTDTLGAITGSIAEAFYGIPAVLIAECKSRIDKGLMTDVLDEFDHVLGRSMDTYSDEMDEIQANQMIEAAIDQYYIQQDKNGMLLFMEVMVTRMQQAGEVVVPYITENPFMSEEQISKVKAGNTISLDHDVRLKIETVKDADEKEWIGVFTSSEEMHKGSAGNVQMNQSIESILRLALKWEQVNGIVINPFGKYIQMTKKMIELLINGYEHYENERKSKDDENN